MPSPLDAVEDDVLLGALVVIAGCGYLADSFTRILVPDFTFTFSLFTFVGEALLIGWLLWSAVRGFPAESEIPGIRAGALSSGHGPAPATPATDRR